MQQRYEPQNGFSFFAPGNPLAFMLSAFRLPPLGAAVMPPIVGEIARTMEPVIQAAARAQLETMSLVAGQMRTGMDLPLRLAACRTPQDVVSTHVQFWRTAAEQQIEGSRRVMEAWSGLCMRAAAQTAQVIHDPAASAERDIITFPEPAEAETGPAAGRAAHKADLAATGVAAA